MFRRIHRIFCELIVIDSWPQSPLCGCRICRAGTCPPQKEIHVPRINYWRHQNLKKTLNIVTRNVEKRTKTYKNFKNLKGQPSSRPPASQPASQLATQ